MTTPQWHAQAAERGPQQRRHLVTKYVSEVPSANARAQPRLMGTSVNAAIQQAMTPQVYRSYREIALPNRFVPPRVAKKNANMSALAEYLKRSERYSESNLYRYSVPARTIGNVVVTAPNLAKGGKREVIRLTHGYDYPESARTSAWTTSDARGEPAAVKRDLVHLSDLEGQDDLVSERRMIALENILAEQRLYRALAADSPDTYPAVKPTRMASKVLVRGRS
jgi:hypothetical protein